MKNKLKLISALLFLAGCSSTQVVDSWKDPSVTEPVYFRRIAVIAITPDESVRRVVEDEVVSNIGKERSFPSYLVLDKDGLMNREKAKEEIVKYGADGAVTMRMIDSKQELNYTPGAYIPPSHAMWNYSMYANTMAPAPGMWTSDTLVRIETNLYSVADEKLLWSGRTETFNPASAKSGAREVANEVRKQLVKEGMAEKPSK
jgi:hypothetical protein